MIHGLFKSNNRMVYFILRWNSHANFKELFDGAIFFPEDYCVSFYRKASLVLVLLHRYFRLAFPVICCLLLRLCYFSFVLERVRFLYSIKGISSELTLTRRFSWNFLILCIAIISSTCLVWCSLVSIWLICELISLFQCIGWNYSDLFLLTPFFSLVVLRFLRIVYLFFSLSPEPYFPLRLTWFAWFFCCLCWSLISYFVSALELNNVHLLVFFFLKNV